MGTTYADHAKAALYRVAAERCEAQLSDSALVIADSVRDFDDSLGGEYGLKLVLRVGHAVPARDADRILRRVRARAEGREVAERLTFWRVKLADGRYHVRSRGPTGDPASAHMFSSLAHAREVASSSGYLSARVVRVTLTRRRILKAKNPGGS